MTWHLAIETSGRFGSFALLQGGELLESVELPTDQRTSASFGPALNSLVNRVPNRRLELVSVVDGPGSFTGLRIGVTIAKSLCFAQRCDLVCVDALAVICQQIRSRATCQTLEIASRERIAVATNAHRGQVFMRVEPFHPGPEGIPDGESNVVDQAVWQDWVENNPCVHVGKYDVERQGFGEALDCPRTADGWPRPVASTVGEIGWKMYQSGKKMDYWAVVPRYLRKSAAEEKADLRSARANPED